MGHGMLVRVQEMMRLQTSIPGVDNSAVTALHPRGCSPSPMAWLPRTVESTGKVALRELGHLAATSAHGYHVRCQLRCGRRTELPPLYEVHFVPYFVDVESRHLERVAVAIDRGHAWWRHLIPVLKIPGAQRATPARPRHCPSHLTIRTNLWALGAVSLCCGGPRQPPQGMSRVGMPRRVLQTLHPFPLS